jgi:4'-phosphopantetheinyl transferase EntD
MKPGVNRGKNRCAPEEDKTLTAPLSSQPGAFTNRNICAAEDDKIPTDPLGEKAGALHCIIRIGPDEELLAGIAVIPVLTTEGSPHLADQLLHPAERAQAAAFRNEVRRISYLSGRVAAKLAIRQVFPGLDSAEINITANPVGKPIAESLPEQYAVSIAHSDHHGAALCFPAENPMGIDIETPEEKNRPIITSILIHSEIALVQAQCDALLILHVMWTAKEAAGKANGLAFRLPVEQYEIEMIKTLEDHKNRSWICNFKHLGKITTISREWQGAILTIAFPSGSGFGDAFMHLYENGLYGHLP